MELVLTKPSEQAQSLIVEGSVHSADGTVHSLGR